MPAASDFANAEAITLAKEFDPCGKRTLGVVTKTDDIQPGCNIKAKLRMEPRQMRLNLGFIAVINRTPIEVENNTPAEQVRARERRFFTTNAELKGLDKEFWGMDTLVERIVAIQAERIQEVGSASTVPCATSPGVDLCVFTGNIVGAGSTEQVMPKLGKRFA